MRWYKWRPYVPVTVRRARAKKKMEGLRKKGMAIQPVEIQIGLRDEVYSEVLAGLEQGDVVVLVKESSREQLQQMMMGGPPR